MKKSTGVTAIHSKANTQVTLDTFPIIGIGASAGGFEAIEQFLAKVPADCGMAFVIVQHLDPRYKNSLCELLQKNTPLTVQQITDRMVVKPEHVYVIPPAHDLTILNGVLLLLDRIDIEGLHLPIDGFLHSLATDKKEQSIAVILSGMGSDGTLGLRSIKAESGAVFVQTPATAKFDSMPTSAINSGLVDVIASPEALMSKIINYVSKMPPLNKDSKQYQSGIEKVIALLRSHTGHDFSLYKKSTIYRRVERRIALQHFTTIAEYINYQRSNPQESDLLFKELLIGVTHFFRDQQVWDKLKTEVIPELLSHYPEGGTLRAWVPACSSGEEAYTLAIVFQEALKKINTAKLFELKIFATDLDIDAIEQARKSIYPKSINQNISQELLERYFVKTDEGYRISKSLRESIIFAPQNVAMDPPFTKLDIISCRNLFIYLEPDLQKKLFPLFHYSLNRSGVLILGTSETIGNDSTLFTPLQSKHRIYKRCDTQQPVSLMKFPTSNSVNYSQKLSLETYIPAKIQGEKTLNLEKLTRSLLDEHFIPAALITTVKADIVYINGKTGNYLEPASGKVNNNLFAMARDGLAAPLSELFNRAVRQKTKLTLRNIEVGTGDSAILVDVCVHPLQAPTEPSGMVLVLFSLSSATIVSIKSENKVEPSSASAKEIQTLKQGLHQAREELQITTNEMQITQENIKSTNEELQSTNEELQSTNEELTTSKEEMQSMNEELRTVNHELNTKIDELSESSDDMKNLLNSTNIATLFLDSELKVRRFTTQTLDIFKLINTDVGRPITDLVSSLIYPTLAADADKVLRTLIYHEEEVATLDDRWYLVRIMPYRTQDNRIDGVVITFTDNTESRMANNAMSESEARFRLLFENSPNAVAYKNIIMEGDKAIDFQYLEVNNSYSAIVKLHDVVGKKGSEVIPNVLQSNPEFLATCGRVVSSGKPETIEYYQKDIKQWFACVMYSQVENLLVCITENITFKKHKNKTLNDIKNRLSEGKEPTATELKQILKNVQSTLEGHSC
jgi:two-component system CheB/CheR fusion protein